VRRYHEEYSRRISLVKSVSILCSEALIPEYEFAWIDKKKEVLYRWVHAYLVRSYKIPLKHCTTSDEYRKEIITFFDNRSCSRSEKDSIHIELKERWNTFFHTGEKFRWLDRSNEIQVKWAWDYLKSVSISFNISLPFDNVSILRETDIYASLIVAFDQWYIPLETKKKLIGKMKKALSQKKLRDKLKKTKNKNSCKIDINEDVKNTLTDLAKFHKMKINQTLEYIINKEFERVCDE
jgi:hypothetical protein